MARKKNISNKTSIKINKNSQLKAPHQNLKEEAILDLSVLKIKAEDSINTVTMVDEVKPKKASAKKKTETLDKVKPKKATTKKKTETVDEVKPKKATTKKKTETVDKVKPKKATTKKKTEAVDEVKPKKAVTKKKTETLDEVKPKKAVTKKKTEAVDEVKPKKAVTKKKTETLDEVKPKKAVTKKKTEALDEVVHKEILVSHDSDEINDNIDQEVLLPPHSPLKIATLITIAIYIVLGLIAYKMIEIPAGGFNPFEYIDVEFSGASMRGHANISLKESEERSIRENELLSLIQFDIQSNGSLVSGQSVLMRIKPTLELEEYINTHNIIFSKTSKGYTVPDLPAYVQDLKDLNVQTLSQLQREAENSIFDQLVTMIDGVDLKTTAVDFYFLKRNVYEGFKFNVLVVVKAEYVAHDGTLINEFRPRVFNEFLIDSNRFITFTETSEMSWFSAPTFEGLINLLGDRYTHLDL